MGDASNMTFTLPIGTRESPQERPLFGEVANLRAENAALRASLIAVTGQRDEYYRQLITRTSALQQELDKALQERSQ
jgi:hypothetical protein